MMAIADTRNHFVDVNKMVGGVAHPRTKGAKPHSPGQLSRGDAPGYRVDAPLARKKPRTKGAKPHSLGQRPRSEGHRPGNAPPTGDPSPNGAKPNPRIARVTPRWGLIVSGWAETRGNAPGYRVDAPLARKNPRTKGAKPVSLGQRPRIAPPSHLSSPERAKPNTAPHEIEAWRAINFINLRVIS
jgi:hypothetical protein